MGSQQWFLCDLLKRRFTLSIFGVLCKPGAAGAQPGASHCHGLCTWAAACVCLRYWASTAQCHSMAEPLVAPMNKVVSEPLRWVKLIFPLAGWDRTVLAIGLLVSGLQRVMNEQVWSLPAGSAFVDTLHGSNSHLSYTSTKLTDSFYITLNEPQIRFCLIQNSLYHQVLLGQTQ